MTLDLSQLVDPEAYDEALYDLVHTVLDRTIELASKVDQTDDSDKIPDSEEEEESETLVEVLRSQAAFTPSERNELSLTNTALSVLLNICICRRAGLYQHPPEEPTSHV